MSGHKAVQLSEIDADVENEAMLQSSNERSSYGRKGTSSLEWMEPKPNEKTYSKTHTDSLRPDMNTLRKAKNVRRLSELFGAPEEGMSK